jgi:ATP-dependent Lon protease
MKIIDLCTVTFDEKDQGGKYWARLASSGLEFVHVEPELVHKHERLFTGGIWANVELSYDETIVHRGVTRPFVLQRLAPIQIASARYDEFVEGRKHFTRDEWNDVLLRTCHLVRSHDSLRSVMVSIGSGFIASLVAKCAGLCCHSGARQ